MVDNTKKQISIGAILAYINVIIQLLVGLLYTPILLKYFGKSQYGVYSLCLSFLSYFSVFNGGTNAAYIRFSVQMKEKNEGIDGLNGFFLKIYLFISVFSFLIMSVMGHWTEAIWGNKLTTEELVLLGDCFKYMPLIVVLQVMNCIFSSIVISNEKFIFGNLLNCMTNLLVPIFTIPFLVNGYSCTIVFSIKLISLVFITFGNMVFCKIILGTKFDLKYRDCNLLKKIVWFAGFIVLQSIMDMLNWQVDKLILAKVSGTEQISIYSVGSTFNTYYITFAAAFSGVFIARINKYISHNEIDAVNNLFIKTCRLFLYLVLLVISGYFIFGKPFIMRWAGEEYGKAFYVGLFLMVPVSFSLVMGLGQDIARAMNRHKLQIVINLFFYLLNVFISIPLAINYGAIGSALGTFLTQMITCAIVQPIYYYKILKLNITKLINEIIPFIKGLVLPFIIGICFKRLDVVKRNYVSICLFGAIYIVVYACSMWFLVMNNEEKNLIKNIIGKVKG